MKLVIMGTYTDKEETVLSLTTYETRPNEPLVASTAEGAHPVMQPLNPWDELVIRVPMVSEEVVVEGESVPA